jgi:hypothetical protein
MAKSKLTVDFQEDDTRFINVDVVLSSRSSLEELAGTLGKQICVLYVGRMSNREFQLRFALYFPKNADFAIRALAKRISSLPTSARRLWRNGQKRVFDVGFQCGFTPRCSEFEISHQAVNAVARLGAKIQITCYVAPGVESLVAKKRRTKTR